METKKEGHEYHKILYSITPISEQQYGNDGLIANEIAKKDRETVEFSIMNGLKPCNCDNTTVIDIVANLDKQSTFYARPCCANFEQHLLKHFLRSGTRLNLL